MLQDAVILPCGGLLEMYSFKHLLDFPEKGDAKCLTHTSNICF